MLLGSQLCCQMVYIHLVHQLSRGHGSCVLHCCVAKRLRKRKPLSCAGTEAGQLAYVAVHGTGTPLGDPIEITALGQAVSRRCAATLKDLLMSMLALVQLAVCLSLKSAGFDCRDGRATAHLTVGSVKSCYGHTEGTAGLTGSLLAMQSLNHQVGS